MQLKTGFAKWKGRCGTIVEEEHSGFAGQRGHRNGEGRVGEQYITHRESPLPHLNALINVLANNLPPSLPPLLTNPGTSAPRARPPGLAFLQTVIGAGRAFVKGKRSSEDGFG